MGFLFRLESRDQASKEAHNRAQASKSSVAGGLKAFNLAAVGEDEAEPEYAFSPDNFGHYGSPPRQEAGATPYANKRMHSVSPVSDSGPTAFRVESMKSQANETTKRPETRAGRKTADREELVEIKPRGPHMADMNRESRTTLEQSAFDDVPPPEVYDPSWNTLPLRCEAGKLGKGTGKSVSVGGSSVLPVAFKITPSLDLETEEEGEDYGTDKEIQDVQDDSMESGKLSRSNTRGRYSIGRMSFGTMSLLGRKKKDGSSPLEIFRTADNLDLTTSRVRSLLTSHYSCDTITIKFGELRTKVSLFDSETSCSLDVHVIFSFEQFDSQTQVIIRRSKTDRARLNPDVFCKFCVSLSSAYRTAFADASVIILLPD
jgi:hypothetical protein